MSGCSLTDQISRIVVNNLICLFGRNRRVASICIPFVPDFATDCLDGIRYEFSYSATCRCILHRVTNDLCKSFRVIGAEITLLRRSL
jgi:hypothetical protein